MKETNLSEKEIEEIERLQKEKKSEELLDYCEKLLSDKGISEYLIMRKIGSLVRLKRADEALELLLETLKSYPKSEKLLAYGAFLYRIKRDAEKTLEYANKSLKLKENSRALIERAQVHMHHKEDDKAIKDVNQAIDCLLGNKEDLRELLRKGMLSYAYTIRGQIYINLHQNKNAIRSFDEAFNLDDTYYYALAGRGAAHFKEGNHDKALQDLEIVIEHYPNDSQSLFIIGNIYQKKEQYEKAKDFLNRSIDVNPKWVEPYMSLAGLYMLQGDSFRAFEYAEEAIELDPDNVMLYGTKAAIAAQSNNFVEALNSLSEAWEKAPSFFEKKRGIKHLNPFYKQLVEFVMNVFSMYLRGTFIPEKSINNWIKKLNSKKDFLSSRDIKTIEEVKRKM